MEEVVPDANTLIYLAKSGMLSTLDRYRVFITDEVYDEAVEKGKENDKSDAYILENHVEDNWLRESVDSERLEAEMNYFGAKGEASVYLLARRENRLAVTSDRVARNKMNRKNIDVLRTDMLLLRQFKDGQLGKLELREKLSNLNSVGGTTGRRINFLMQKAEEYKLGEQDD